MKRWLAYGLLCCLLCASVARAEDVFPLMPDVAPQNQDEALWNSFCEQSSFEMPEGTVLETLILCHLTFDGSDGVAAALLSEDGAERTLCVLISDDGEWESIVNPSALPQPGGEAVFLGFSNEPGLWIHVLVPGAWQEVRSYRMTNSAGDIVLASVQTLAWEEDSATGSRESLDFMEGIRQLETTEMDGDSYRLSGTSQQDYFDPPHIPLESLDLDDFPVHLDEYLEWMGAGAQPDRLVFLQCPVCGLSEPAASYAYHACPMVLRAAAPITYCEVCCFWFESGGFADHYCVGKKKTAYCEACGGWYAPGSDLRDHVCVGILYGYVE